MGLATPSDSLGGSLLAAATPAVSREIGDYFKKLNPETGKDRQGTPAHLTAHMIWNAAVAYATGNNTAAAALSAGSSEAAAPVISNWLFNQKDPSKLDEEQKAALANITGLLGSGIGAATGDYRNAVSDGLIGQTVTEHNNAARAAKGVAIPAIGALYCALDKNCESVTETFIGMMAEQRRQAQEEHDAIFAAIQNTQKGGKKAQPKPQQQGSQATTGAPMPPDDEDERNIRTTHNSVKESPNYPKGFRDVQNGTRKVNINNQEVLNQLRKIEKGEWKKVYRDGFDSNGKKISVHYFQNTRTGKVFNIKVKNNWSNF